MSNALHTIIAATSPAAKAVVPAAGKPSPLITTLTGIGLCVLVIWTVRRLIHPGKFKLTVCPARRNCLNPAHILAVFFVAIAANGLVLSIPPSLLAHDSAEILILRGLCQASVGLLAAVAIGAWAFRSGVRRGMGLTCRRWLVDSTRGVIGYLAVLPICVILLEAVKWAVETMLRDGTQILKPHLLLEAIADPSVSGSWRVLGIVSAAVLAPLAEEVFFRGLLQSMFRRYFRSPWAAVVLSSVVFAMVHVPNWHHMPALLALGVVLGYNYERTGRLYAPILIHLLFNSVFLVARLTTA